MAIEEFFELALTRLDPTSADADEGRGGGRGGGGLEGVTVAEQGAVFMVSPDTALRLQARGRC